jgi:hypothetical protein
MVAHLNQGCCSQGAPSAIRDVVRHDRDRARVSHDREVLDDRSFGGSGVVRNDDQCSDGRCANGQAIDLVDGPTRAVGPSPDDQPSTGFLAGPVAGLDDATAFLGGERRRLTGRSQRHQPGGPVGQKTPSEPLE